MRQLKDKVCRLEERGFVPLEQSVILVPLGLQPAGCEYKTERSTEVAGRRLSDTGA